MVKVDLVIEWIGVYHCLFYAIQLAYQASFRAMVVLLFACFCFCFFFLVPIAVWGYKKPGENFVREWDWEWEEEGRRKGVFAKYSRHKMQLLLPFVRMQHLKPDLCHSLYHLVDLDSENRGFFRIPPLNFE